MIHLYDPVYGIWQYFGWLAWPFVFVMWFKRKISSQTYVTAVTIWALLIFVGLIGSTIIDIKRHSWGNVAGDILFLALTAWILWDVWKRWKDKKKAAELIGAKTRALKDKVLRKYREGLQPIPERIKG
jgi:heme A synthase